MYITFFLSNFVDEKHVLGFCEISKSFYLNYYIKMYY